MNPHLRSVNNLALCTAAALFFTSCVTERSFTALQTDSDPVTQYIASHPELTSQETNALILHAVTIREIEDNRQSSARNAPGNRERHADALANQQALRDAIAAHQIMLDMTPQELLATWGDPASRTHTVSREDIYDAWFYPDRSTTVSLYNGRVSHWTTTEHTPDRSSKVPHPSRSGSGLKRTDL